MIVDRDRLSRTDAHETALCCVDAGLDAAQCCLVGVIDAAKPRRLVADALRFDGSTLTVGEESHDLAAFEAVRVLGGGNAAAQVAAALEDVLGDALDGGLVVTDDPVETETVAVRPADHPIPSERGVESTAELLDRAAATGEETLVLAVTTGGASACLAAPASGLTLRDVQSTTAALLDAGAPIRELNAVRKHLSAVKGGRLARALDPATVSALVISDVVGDDPAVVGSGPLAGDQTTYADALNVLDAYDVAVPEAVCDRLEAGAAGEHEETPGPGDPAVEAVETHVIGTNLTALEAARDAAADRGYRSLVLSSRVRGEARNAALGHVAIAEEIVASGHPVEPPAVVLSGGETTVAVAGDGRGGPNQEFALAAALDLPQGAVLAAVDTDGIDGNTDAAGALVDAQTVGDREAAERAVAANDVNPRLAERGVLLRTGPTGTNVNDLRVLVVGTPVAD
jgi:hydroxypyruvate reductase